MSNKISMGGNRLATGLAWFGIGIGLFGMIASRMSARLMGVPHRPLLFRLLGLREIATGLGILNSHRKSNWLWGRVSGDALDLGLLGAAIGQRGSKPGRIGAIMGGIGAITALDILGGLLNLPAKPVHIVRAITVDRNPEDLYRAWRNFTNFPQFMENVVSIALQDENRSHWVVKGPGKTKLEWDAEITDDIPNERISWHSTGLADVENWGSVHFIPSPVGRGTIVRVTLDYLPPAAGRLGAFAALLLGREPRLQTDVDLHRFEQWMETGSVMTTKGQPAARAQSKSPLYDLAQGR